MKYFTPELYVRGQSDDETIQGEVDLLWEEAVESYEQALQKIRPLLPERIRYFLDELLLHDAVVLSLARQQDRLIMVLQKDIPPKDIVTLTYTLVAEPVINTAALPEQHRSNVMGFMYDEFDLIQDGELPLYTQSILFSNGWEIQLRFSDVQVSRAQSVYPVVTHPSPVLQTA
jgi:hypothetical protein